MEKLATPKSIDPTRAVCFSGHRPSRLPGNGNPDVPEAQKLIRLLRERIVDAVRRDKVFFLHGAMAGFDIFAAEHVIVLKEQYPQIRLVTVAPYKARFFSREKCWTPDWVSRAREVFNKHDLGITVAERYRSGIYYERNRVLVDHSSELICYHDGGKGGTQYTVQYALNKKLTVCNLYE